VPIVDNKQETLRERERERERERDVQQERKEKHAYIHTHRHTWACDCAPVDWTIFLSKAYKHLSLLLDHQRQMSNSPQVWWAWNMPQFPCWVQQVHKIHQKEKAESHHPT